MRVIGIRIGDCHCRSPPAFKVGAVDDAANLAQDNGGVEAQFLVVCGYPPCSAVEDEIERVAGQAELRAASLARCL
jgi:hypothetical protein